MFRNKILLRAIPSPSPSPAPFFLLPLSLSPVSPLDLRILCCKLSRRWRLACLPQPSHILLIYQKCQSNVVSEVVAEVAAAFPDVSAGEEEEVSSGSIITKAVECGLRSVMLDHKWRCIGESTFVNSTLASSEERSNLCAVNVQVRYERNDEYEFLVSPDALWFSRHKISDLAGSKMMEMFENSKEVVLEGCSFLTACTTLPSLCEGHVIGFSKVLPPEKCLDKFVKLCSLKHGLAIENNYYVAVQLAYEGCMEKQWFPSSLVLQGSGLYPAPKSLRGLKAMSSLESFIEILKVWNFFGSSHLIIKEQAVLSSTTLPTWEKARTSLTCDIMRTDSFEEDDFNCKFFSVKDQFLDLDFRTPKPPFQYSSGDALRTTKIQEIAPSLDVGSSDITRKGVEDVYTSQHILTCGQLVSKPLTTSTSCSVQVQMMRPSFSRSKGTDKTKKGSSPRHLATDSSHEQSHASPVNSSSERLLKSSLAGPVNSSSLLKPSHSGPVNLATEIGPRNGPLINTGRAIMQSTGDHVSRKSAKHLEFKIQNIVQSSLPDSQNPQKNHEEFLNSSCQEGPAKVQQGNSSEKRATDRKKKISPVSHYVYFLAS